MTSTRTTDAMAAGLSTLDRFLPVWIGVAMAAGLLLGRFSPGLSGALSAVEVEGISLPIAVGRRLVAVCLGVTSDEASRV
jgi:arsenite transporter